MVIIGKNGFVNDLLLWLSIIEKPIQILYTEFAVIIGLTYLFLPLMILPLVGVMENIEVDLLDSAKSLGASNQGVFFKSFFLSVHQGCWSGPSLFSPEV